MVTRAELQSRVGELGSKIGSDYLGRDLFVVGVLKGALIFLADLLRHLGIPCEIDFMTVSSYGSGTRTSGAVRVVSDLNGSIEGRNILIVEDIIESGVTLRYLTRHLKARGAASVETCALLMKPDQLRVDVDLRYVGFQVPDRFVVGYGLDYAERYRNLDHIAVLAKANGD